MFKLMNDEAAEDNEEHEGVEPPEPDLNGKSERQNGDRLVVSLANGWTFSLPRDNADSKDADAESPLADEELQACNSKPYLTTPGESERDKRREQFIDLFNPADVRRKLPMRRGLEMDLDSGDIRPAETPRSSESLSEWEAKLKEILNDRCGPRRRLLVADARLLKRLTRLRTKCPGFEQIVDLITRAAHLSAAARSPLRLPAILLVGPAGIGKTHFARELAAALAVPCEFICGDLLSDHGTVTGLSTAWRAAKPGRIATALLDSPVASPLFIIDEVDKVNAIHERENPWAFLHTVLEPENAKKFCDEYLSFPMRADHCFWILTCNETDVLSAPILDRLMIINVKAPDQAAMMVIARNMYKQANERHNDWFEPEPSEEFLTVLVRHNPRKATKIVEIAMCYAATDGRTMLTSKDVAVSADFLESNREAQRKVGFIAS